MKAVDSFLLASVASMLAMNCGLSSAIAHPMGNLVLAQAATTNEHNEGERARDKQKKVPKHETQPAPGAVKPHEKQAPAAQRQLEQHPPAGQQPKSAQTPGAGEKSKGVDHLPKQEAQPAPAVTKPREKQVPAVQRQPEQLPPAGQKPKSAQTPGPAATPKAAEQPRPPAAQQPVQGSNEKRQGTQPLTSPRQGGQATAVPHVPIQRAAVPNANTTAVPPPTQTISKQQFIAPKGQAPTANITQLKQQRQEVREGNRLVIREPGRAIVAESGRTFVRHNEVDRFAVDARAIHVDRQGNQTVTVVERPGGVRIIDISDDRGHLIRRVRRNPDGREIVIIDNSFAGPKVDQMFVEIAPPMIRIPHDRYIVDADRAREADIYDVFIAAPVEHIDHRYTLDEVRYSEPLRARMPRVDLDINFDTGSWQLTPDQVDRLAVIAQALNRAIARNPREVFLVEGHTDAVGSDIDNLSLSDRRAESVAVALTEEFHVPPENLVTQGYGKQDLKVQTSGPERANRRVAIRRITPLIDRLAASPPP